jgi:hypothetical protein
MSKFVSPLVVLSVLVLSAPSSNATVTVDLRNTVAYLDSDRVPERNRLLSSNRDAAYENIRSGVRVLNKILAGTYKAPHDPKKKEADTINVIWAFIHMVIKKGKLLGNGDSFELQDPEKRLSTFFLDRRTEALISVNGLLPGNYESLLVKTSRRLGTNFVALSLKDSLTLFTKLRNALESKEVKIGDITDVVKETAIQLKEQSPEEPKYETKEKKKISLFSYQDNKLSSERLETINDLNSYYAQIYYSYTPKQRHTIARKLSRHQKLRTFVRAGYVLKKPLYRKDYAEDNNHNKGTIDVKLFDPDSTDHYDPAILGELYRFLYVEYCKVLTKQNKPLPQTCEDLDTNPDKKLRKFLNTHSDYLQEEYLEHAARRLADAKTFTPKEKAKHFITMSDCLSEDLNTPVETLSQLTDPILSMIQTDPEIQTSNPRLFRSFSSAVSAAKGVFSKAVAADELQDSKSNKTYMEKLAQLTDTAQYLSVREAEMLLDRAGDTRSSLVKKAQNILETTSNAHTEACLEKEELDIEDIKASLALSPEEQETKDRQRRAAELERSFAIGESSKLVKNRLKVLETKHRTVLPNTWIQKETERLRPYLHFLKLKMQNKADRSVLSELENQFRTGTFPDCPTVFGPNEPLLASVDIIVRHYNDLAKLVPDQSSANMKKKVRDLLSAQAVEKLLAPLLAIPLIHCRLQAQNYGTVVKEFKLGYFLPETLSRGLEKAAVEGDEGKSLVETKNITDREIEEQKFIRLEDYKKRKNKMHDDYKMNLRSLVLGNLPLYMDGLKERIVSDYSMIPSDSFSDSGAIKGTDYFVSGYYRNPERQLRLDDLTPEMKNKDFIGIFRDKARTKVTQLMTKTKDAKLQESLMNYLLIIDTEEETGLFESDYKRVQELISKAKRESFPVYLQKKLMAKAVGKFDKKKWGTKAATHLLAASSDGGFSDDLVSVLGKSHFQNLVWKVLNKVEFPPQLKARLNGVSAKGGPNVRQYEFRITKPVFQIDLNSKVTKGYFVANILNSMNSTYALAPVLIEYELKCDSPSDNCELANYKLIALPSSDKADQEYVQFLADVMDKVLTESAKEEKGFLEDPLTPPENNLDAAGQ